MAPELRTESTPKNRDLLPRVAVAVFGIPILLSVAFLGPNWLLGLVVIVTGAIGTWEFLRMTLQRDFRIDGFVGLSATIAVLIGFYWADTTGGMALAVFAAVTAMFTSALLSMRDYHDALQRIGAICTTFVYIVTLFGAFLFLIKDTPRNATSTYQAGWFLFPMFLVWSGDTFAYFVGRAFGTHKLAPRISPGKTWEGAAGGLVGSVLGAFFAYWILPMPEMAVWLIIVIAIPGAILGQIGDLCISLVKRATGFKDASSILYGHGGMLDRVDALMFACPWVLIAGRMWLKM